MCFVVHFVVALFAPHLFVRSLHLFVFEFPSREDMSVITDVRILWAWAY